MTKYVCKLFKLTEMVMKLDGEYILQKMKTLPGIPKVIEEMPFPENDQQIVTHETAPPDITLEIVSPKLI
jgi:hypothetical protein